MRLTISKLPPLAHAVRPTLDTLGGAFRWHLDASDRAKERYRRARMEVLRVHAGADAGHEQVFSSGSTGVRKSYKWGPDFETVDRFFYSLVKDGDRLKKTLQLHLGDITFNGLPNVVKAVRMDEKSYNIKKHVILSLNGQGDVPGLKEELAGWNVFISASTQELLDRWTNFTDLVDRDALMIFTGEALPDHVCDRLRSRGLDVRDQMRCWDGGATFFTCRYGGKHWVDMLADVRFEKTGVVSTDLLNLSQPHVDYANGDVVDVTWGDRCQCGMVDCRTEFRNRVAFTVFTTPLGASITYETIHSLFLRAGHLAQEDLLFLAVGKGRGEVDKALKLHYLVDKPCGEDFERAVAEEFYLVFGMRVTLHKYVESSRFKIRKIYWVDDDQPHGAEAGNPS